MGFFFVHRPAENRFDLLGFRLLSAQRDSHGWHLVADLGSAPVLFAGSVVAAALASWRHDLARGLAALVGPSAAVLVTEWLAKPLASRDVNPFGAHSYPSGTVTAACALSAAIVLAAPRRLRPILVGLAIAADLAVACAVIALRWHFPTDVAGGALVGVGGLLLADALARLCPRAMRHAVAPRGARELTLHVGTSHASGLRRRTGACSPRRAARHRRARELGAPLRLAGALSPAGRVPTPAHDAPRRARRQALS